MLDGLAQQIETSRLWQAAWICLGVSIVLGLLTMPALFMWFGDPAPGTTLHHTPVEAMACLFNVVTVLAYPVVWIGLSIMTLTRLPRFKPWPAVGLLALLLASPLAAAAALAGSFFLWQTFP